MVKARKAPWAPRAFTALKCYGVKSGRQRIRQRQADFCLKTTTSHGLRRAGTDFTDEHRRGWQMVTGMIFFGHGEELAVEDNPFGAGKSVRSAPARRIVVRLGSARRSASRQRHRSARVIGPRW